MDGEIILDRRDTNVMKLDDNEQALMNEIEIEVPRPRQRPQPVKKQVSQDENPVYSHHNHKCFQEDIDSFANPRTSRHSHLRPHAEAPV
jgi:hypothetical protein